MLMEQNCSIIVSLNNNEIIKEEDEDEKILYNYFMNGIATHQYWPDSINKPKKIGKYLIELLYEENDKTNNIMIRKLCINDTIKKIKKEINFLQYYNWPDMDIPKEQNNFINLIKIVNNLVEKNPGKICVHCSAGVGRTGTFCCCNIIYNQLKKFDSDNNLKEYKFNIFKIVSLLKEQRIGMVQTLSQYIFCHEIILNISENIFKINF